MHLFYSRSKGLQKQVTCLQTLKDYQFIAFRDVTFRRSKAGQHCENLKLTGLLTIMKLFEFLIYAYISCR